MRIIFGYCFFIVVTIILLHKKIHHDTIECSQTPSPAKSESPTDISVKFPADLNEIFQNSLADPCDTDYFIEAWFGTGSKLNIYSYLMVDAFLSNKTASVWLQPNDSRHSQLAQFIISTFDVDKIPICLESSHTGKFHNDQRNLKSYKKLGLSYDYLMDLLSGTIQYLFDNIRSEIKDKSQNILKTIPRPFYSVNVRWGDKLKHESDKIELPLYFAAMKKEKPAAMIHMMSLESVTDKFGKISGTRTVNYHEDILVEILIAAEADIFFGTESSNIFRIIYKLRKGKNMTNIESKRVYPIRIWLTNFKRLLRIKEF